jgi:hypothetical protein
MPGEQHMSSAAVHPVPSSKDRARPDTPAYWIFVPALIVAGYVVALSLKHTAAPVALKDSFRWMGVPAAFVFVAAAAGPACRVLKWKLAAAICAAIVLGLYCAIGAYLFVGSSWQSPIGLLYFWPLWLPAFVVAALAAISCGRRLGPGWAVGGAIIGIFCGLLAMNTAIAARQAKLNYPRPLDPAVLAPDVVTFAKCAQSFAAAHPGSGYPQSLAELGPQGSACLPESFVTQQSKGFAFTYQPGEKDAAGKVMAYSLRAVEISPKGKDTSSIFTNESGVVKYRFDGPHGKGSTVVYSPGQYACEQVVHSLWQAGGSGPWRFVSGQTTDTVTDRDEYMRRWLTEAVFSGKRSFTLGGYDFHYDFTPGDTEFLGFTMAARPHAYGVGGIRSYLFIDSYDGAGRRHRLHVYATPEDRVATPSDPSAERSEFQFAIDIDPQ